MSVKLRGMVATVQESAEQVAASSEADLRQRAVAGGGRAEPGLHAGGDLARPWRS